MFKKNCVHMSLKIKRIETQIYTVTIITNSTPKQAINLQKIIQV